MAKQPKIDQYGLGDEVLRLKSEGYSLREIASKLNTQYNVTLQFKDVDRYLKKNFDKTVVAGAKDEETRDRARKLIEEAEDEFRAVRDELWEYIQDLKQKGDLSSRRVLALSALVKTFDSILKTAGAITKTKEVTTTERTLILDMAKNAGLAAQNLEKEGYVVVRKKKKQEQET